MWHCCRRNSERSLRALLIHVLAFNTCYKGASRWCPFVFRTPSARLWRAPLVCNLDTVWRCVANFTLRPHCLPPHPFRPYQLNWGLGGRQGRWERFEDGTGILPLPGMVTRIDNGSLVAGLNTLYKASLSPNISLCGLKYISFCSVKCGPLKKIISTKDVFCYHFYIIYSF